MFDIKGGRYYYDCGTPGTSVTFWPIRSSEGWADSSQNIPRFRINQSFVSGREQSAES